MTAWPEAAWEDEGLGKHHGECLVSGSAFAPDGMAMRALLVRVAAGSINKALVVSGDRFWKGETASTRLPFVEMPLDWQHAFGGERFADNPLGKGLGPDADGLHALPNIEAPSRLVAAPSDRPTPAGFGIIPPEWPQRARRLGTYDQAWLERDWPGYARDMDPRYFNLAPPDQWLPEGHWWRGDEEVRVENMHPTWPVLEGRLPGLRARCFVNQRLADRTHQFREVSMHLETIVLLPNVERIVLVFRGTAPVEEDDADDVVHALAALEGLGEAKTREHYQRAFAKRLDRKLGARTKDDDLLPSWITPGARLPDEPPRELEQLLKTGKLMEKNLRRRAELELERTREEIRKRGLDPDAQGVPKALPPPADELDDEQADKVVEGLEKRLENGRAETADLMKAEMDRARAVCAEQGIDFERQQGENAKNQGGPPKFRAEQVLSDLGEVATLCRNAGVPDEENGALARLADPALRAELARMEKSALDAYREFAHHFPAAWSLEGDEADRVRRQVEELHAEGKSLAGRDFTGADLSRLDLSGADFMEALLENCDLSGANLERANFTSAVLTRADLEGARTAGIRLAGANLGGARLAGLDLSGVDLRAAVMIKADLADANLQGASVEGCDFAEASLTNANLEKANGRHAQFSEARIEGARFSGADLRDAVFHGLDVSRLDFSHARLDKAEFFECTGTKTNFADASMLNTRFSHIDHRCSFEDAVFSRAKLAHANLRDVELNRAAFAAAEMSDTDLSKADCEEADFSKVRAKNSLWIRTNLKNANLWGADLRGAVMKNARLAGTRLRRANLFGANLMFVRVDGATDIQDAELGQIVYREEKHR